MVASSRMGRTMVLNRCHLIAASPVHRSPAPGFQLPGDDSVDSRACARGRFKGLRCKKPVSRESAKTSDTRTTDKVAMGEVLSNLDQVFFDLPAAAGTPPRLSSGSHPVGGV